MKRILVRPRILLAYGLILSATFPAFSQATEPYLAYAYPAGGQAGTSLRISVAGQYLKGADSVIVSGKGVRAAVLAYQGSGGLLTKVQEEELRRRIEALIKEKTQAAKQTAGGSASSSGAAASASPAASAPTSVSLPDLPELEGLESKSVQELKLLADRFLNVNSRPKAPMNELVEIELSLDASAEQGRRELRLLAAGGISNPVAFYVGGQPEAREAGRFDPPAASPPAPFSPPLTLNGQIFPGVTDSFPLALKAGDKLRCSAYARDIVPYLADAVPGWFQAVMYVRGPGGEELAYNDDAGADPDPVLSFTAPEDGVYRLYIRDSIYRGRFDFVYRIVVESSRAPGAVSAPEVGSASAKSSRAGQDAQADPGGEIPASRQPGLWLSDAISSPGEIDVYRYLASPGQKIAAEVRAWRDGSPLDATLRLLDPDGKPVAFSDDAEDKEEGLVTRHADPYLLYTATVAGSYSLMVADACGKGGPDYRYALRFGPPVEDFAVISERSSINIPASGSALLRLKVLRKDGWAGDIEIRPRKAYPGLSIEGGSIPAGSDSARITLSWSGVSPSMPMTLELEARGKIGEKLIARRVQPADSMMQAFATFHLVPAHDLWLGFARGKLAPRTLAWTRGSPESTQSASGARLRIPAGGTASIKLSIKPRLDTASGTLVLELVDPPPGIALEGWSAVPGGLALRISATAAGSSQRDTLIIKASMKQDATGAKPKDLGYLPALPIEVVGR